MRNLTRAAAAALLAGTLAGCTTAELHKPDTTPTYGNLLPTPGPTAVVDPPPPTELAEPARGRAGQVIRVVDGDTVRVLLGDVERTVRIIGLDTPETVHPSKPVECYGPEASAEGKRLLDGKTVQVVTDPSQGAPHPADPTLRADRYDRVLAYIEVDGLDYGAHMIGTGHATEYTYRSAYERQDLYRVTEQVAADQGTGLHGAC